MIWLNDFGHLNSTIQAKQLYSLVVRQPLGQFAMENGCVQLPEVSSKDILGILSKDQIFMNQSKRKHKECSLLTNGEVNG